MPVFLLLVWNAIGRPGWKRGRQWVRMRPTPQRVAITVAFQFVIALFFFVLDHSLGYAVLTIAAIWWLQQVPPIPWKLVGEAILVVIYLAAGVRSLAIALAIAFAAFWIPQRHRRWAMPTL